MKKSWYNLGVKAVVFIVCVFVIDAIIGKSFELMEGRIYQKKPLSMPSHYMVTDLEADVIILGASIASRHYIPSLIEDSLHVSAYNCGFDGTPFVVQNSLLNLMLDRYNPKIIIWEIGMLSMEKDSVIQHLSYLYPYYDKNKQAKDVVDGIDKYQRIRMLSKTYRYNSVALNELRTLLGSTLRESELSLKGYMPLDTAGYVFPTKIKMKYDNTLDDSKVRLLEKTLERCKLSNVKMIITSSPQYINNYDEIGMTLSYKSIAEMADKYEVPLLDFSDSFSNDSTLFKDNAHLNDNGARRYMSVFIPVLKNLFFKKHYANASSI